MDINQQNDAARDDTPRQGLKDDLLAALSRIQTPGSFASLRRLSEPPPVGLYVPGIGHIAMPLSESHKCQLVAAASQAPYGKGSATIVDTAVRNTWELAAEQFALQDPAWPAFLDDVCTYVARDLGIEAKITAELYKMLIYEKGAMFKAHTDTEKVPGMFGTLVICLPSLHQGGEVVVKHCGQKKVLKTSEAIQSFACWYSDVSHEVLPVTSGVRWVLTFNLALDPAAPRPSAALQRSETQHLRRTLTQWLAEDEASRQRPFVYHVLDHEYTEANISLEALKTRDRAQVQALQAASAECPVHIFFALLELKEWGNCENDVDFLNARHCQYTFLGGDDEEDEDEDYHCIEEVFEKEYEVKTLFDLEGRMVATSLLLDKDDILQSDCFDGLEAEEEYEGYMGNSGPTATHWYRTTAVAIVPCDSIVSFFKTRGPQSSSLAPKIRYLAKACLRSQPPPLSMDALMHLCEEATAPKQSTMYKYAQQSSFDADGIRDVLKVAILYKRHALFEKAAAHHQDLLPVDLFLWLRQRLETEQDNFDSLFTVLEKGLSSAVMAYRHFAKQFGAVSSLVPAPRDALAPGTACTSLRLDWARRMLRTCLSACETGNLGRPDGAAMVDVAPYFDNPSDFLSKTVAPTVCSRHEAAAFMLEFLGRLHDEHSAKGMLSVEMQVYVKVATCFLGAADFIKLMRSRLATGQSSGLRDERQIVTESMLTNFFSTAIDMSTDGDDLEESLVSKIATSASGFPSLELYSLWLPFLQSLVPVLVSKGKSLISPKYQKLFSAVFGAYLATFLGPKPLRDGNLRRRGVECNCFDCKGLNAFLNDAKLSTGRFAVNKQRRMHLHRELDSAGVDCVHETERVGSPQTLVVTKTFRHVAKRLQDWNSRREMAAKQVQQFEQDQLEQLLGSSYSATVEALGAAVVQRQAGVKRKLPLVEAEVIDLTSD